METIGTAGTAGAGNSLDSATIAAFRSSLLGAALTSADAGYDDAQPLECALRQTSGAGGAVRRRARRPGRR